MGDAALPHSRYPDPNRSADVPREAQMSTVANRRETHKRVVGRRYARGLALAAVLAVALLLLLVDCDSTSGARAVGNGTGDTGLGSSSASFTIAGSATESISPGVKAPLDLKLTNPHDFPMSVTDLRVTVQKVSAPNADNARPCSIGDFAVGQASSKITITVAARATSALSSLGLARAAWPQVGMLDRSVNQDGCKGASLTLGYAASGTLAQ
jgi:hypothetical protein